MNDNDDASKCQSSYVITRQCVKVLTVGKHERKIEMKILSLVWRFSHFKQFALQWISQCFHVGC